MDSVSGRPRSNMRPRQGNGYRSRLPYGNKEDGVRMRSGIDLNLTTGPAKCNTFIILQRFALDPPRKLAWVFQFPRLGREAQRKLAFHGGYRFNLILWIIPVAFCVSRRYFQEQNRRQGGKALLDDWNYLPHRPDFRDREHDF